MMLARPPTAECSSTVMIWLNLLSFSVIFSLKGFKVTYSKSKSKRYNVSERFIKNKPLVYNLAKKNCYYE